MQRNDQVATGRKQWIAPALERLEVDLASIAATNSGAADDGARTGPKKRVPTS